MHRCLSILDIQWLIFSYCRRRTLVKLAMTCKSFHETALDLIWRKIRFNNLIKAMPADLWTHTSSRTYPHRQCIVRNHQLTLLPQIDVDHLNRNYADPFLPVIWSCSPSTQNVSCTWITNMGCYPNRSSSP